jgi:hypothetical protein
VLGGCAEYLGGEPSARGVEVDVTRSDSPDLDPGGCDDLRQLHQVGESPVQPIGVVGDDHVDLTPADEVEQTTVLGTAGTAVGAQVVVDEHFVDAPALQLGELAAGVDLAANTGRLADLVQRDPGVDRCAPEQRRCARAGVRLSPHRHVLRSLLGCSGPPVGVPPVGAAQRDVITSEISRWCCRQAPCRPSDTSRSS